MKSQDQILIEKGFNPEYSNAIFNEDSENPILASVSKEKGKNNLYAAMCITIEDNQITDFDKMQIDKETFREMCLTSDIIYTNFGVDIHSHTLKNTTPFSNIKLIKVSTED